MLERNILLEKEIKQLQQQLAEKDREILIYSNMYRGQENQLDNLKALDIERCKDLEKLRKRKSDLKGEVDGLQTNISSLQKEVDRKDNEIKRLMLRVERQDKKIATLEGYVEKHEGKIDKLREERDDLREALVGQNPSAVFHHQKKNITPQQTVQSLAQHDKPLLGKK